MEYYVTSIEDLEEACLRPLIYDELADEKIVDIAFISDQTKNQLLDELLSQIRNDPRLEEIDDCIFFCKKKHVLDVERKYGITMVDAEMCGFEL